MAKDTGRKNSREKILDAAEDVVTKIGAGHLTLDAVAEKAGVSKGGLIYNFPSKEALLKAMVERLIARMDELFTARKAELPPGKTQAIKAFISSFPPRDARMKKVSAALLAAGAHDSRLLAPAREAHRKGFAEFTAAGMRPELAAIIAFAVDGIWLTELLDIAPLPKERRGKITKELLKLADDGSSKARRNFQ